MKSLRNYIDERLVINKNYIALYKYYPKNRKELLNAIEEHYDNNIYNLNDIDVYKITDFGSLFMNDTHTSNENFDVSKWDVRNGKDFSDMFCGCENFNCDLSEWDVSNGEDFSDMFANCSNFNCDLSHWNVSKGKNFLRMFYGCKNFNSDLSDWVISNAIKFRSMFYKCGIDDKNKPNGV